MLFQVIFNALDTDSNVERARSQSVEIQVREGDVLIAPDAEFTGQLSTQTCAEVVISASQSSGSGGRALTVEWKCVTSDSTWQPGEPYYSPVACGMLLPYFIQANADSAVRLDIAPKDFYEAFEAAKTALTIAEFLSRDVYFGVEITITNFLGLSHTETRQIQILSSAEPIPQVQPQVDLKFSQEASQEVYLAIKTAAAVSPSPATRAMLAILT